MKITESKVRKLLIEEVDHLDPVTVFLEDMGTSRGRITIECWGKSWTSFWGAMGGRTISQFFCSCDQDYLAKNLGSGIPRFIDDEEKSVEYIKNEILRQRKCSEIDPTQARNAFEEVESAETVRGWLQEGSELVRLLYADEWWGADLPRADNPDYRYLCRIINAVKEALKESEEPKVIDKTVSGYISEMSQMANSN